ncbi:MAG: alpha/beta fold hydrolase [Verrucomicrobia bacterium]|nr:alpha/beta fold hydrolase [Verrucomicrobiota bacterium]
MTTPLLLVSGWAHTAEALQPLADRLARQYTVRALAVHDLGGLAMSNPSELSDFAAGLCRELQREQCPCVLVGWSMGGMIALEAAAAFPERVAALVLISSAPRLAAALDFPHGVPPRVLRAMTLSFQLAPERTLSEFFINAAFPHLLTPTVLREKVAAAMVLGADRLAEQLRYLTESDLREAARRLTAPVLILHGRPDRIIPVGAASWIIEQRPGTEMITCNDSGHDFPLDEPDRVAEPIEHFLKHPG